MKQGKETIFLDLDETLAKTIEDWVYPIVNSIYWTNFTFDTTNNYRDVFWDSIQKNWTPITIQEKIKIFKDAITQDLWNNQIGTVAWSVQKVLELSKWYNLKILTARHPDLINYTTLWTQNKFSWAIKEILFSNCYHWWETTKLDICNSKWVKIMIEDDIDYTLELAKWWIKVFLLKKPWNRERKEKHRNIVKVNWWEEIQI